MGVLLTDVFSEILDSVSLANVIPQFGDGFSFRRLGETGDLPTGPGGIIRFAGSSDNTWSGLLRIEDWSGDPIFGGGHEQVYFGADPFGLTQAQLDAIRFYNDAGDFLGSARYLLTGEIVPQPCPKPPRRSSASSRPSPSPRAAAAPDPRPRWDARTLRS